MLDSNGQQTQLTLDAALAAVLANAAAAGVTVPAGSAEDQLAEWQAQGRVDVDNAVYKSVVQQYSPTGSNIDIQNPGFPRLQPSVSSGFLKIHNGTAGTLAYPLSTIFAAPNGVRYTNLTASLSVLAGATKFLAVTSVNTGAANNLPQNQIFTGPAGTVTNPQPITGGLDLETDPQYLNRLFFDRSNNTSQQSTVTAKKELLQFYQACAVYVNSSNNGTTVPVPIPPSGLNAVVLFDSGANAGPEEIAQAVQIMVNRFEFGNLNSFNTALHPILTGSIFTGVFPQSYSITVAQAVASYVTLEVNVSFPSAALDAEKPVLAQAFATAFVQRIINLLSGAAGSYNFTFTPLAALPATNTTPAVVASSVPPAIGPFVSIEALRALIAGGDSAGDFGGLNLLSTGNLTVEFDPGEYGQSPVTLSIFAPYEGTLAKVNFVLDSLFTDGTSWYDRFIFLNPVNISVSVTEVSA